MGSLYNINFSERGILSALSIPSSNSSTSGSPAAVVLNESNIIPNNQSANVIFAGTDGIISGSNPSAGNSALVIKNNAADASYTGLAIGTSHEQNFLYAANFQPGKIEVYDRTFKLVPSKKYVDPFLPKGFHPLTIHYVEDHLVLTYAKPGSDGKPIAEQGNGIVNIFTAAGVLAKRFATKGTLNAPTGVAAAPAGFFPGINHLTIVIANSGDGTITAYTATGQFLGYLQDSREELFVLDGLWAIGFGPAVSDSDPGPLYFSLGHTTRGSFDSGLFGRLVRL